jgi:hypothetical protein
MLFSPTRPATEIHSILIVVQRYRLLDIRKLIIDTVRTAWHAATFGWHNTPALPLACSSDYEDENEDELSSPPFPSPVLWLKLALKLADQSMVRSVFMYIWSVGSVFAGITRSRNTRSRTREIKEIVEEGHVSERDMQELWEMYQLIDWKMLGERELNALTLINNESLDWMSDIEAWGLLPVNGEYCGNFVNCHSPGQSCPRMCNIQAVEMLQRIGHIARLTGKTYTFLRVLYDSLAPCHGNNGILCRIGDRINSPDLDPESLMTRELDGMCKACRAHLRAYVGKVRFGVDKKIKYIIEQYMAPLFRQ